MVWQSVNSGIITVDLSLEIDITVIQVYAPTEESDVQGKEEFFMELNKIIEKYVMRVSRQ